MKSLAAHAAFSPETSAMRLRAAPRIGDLVGACKQKKPVSLNYTRKHEDPMRNYRHTASYVRDG
jgi:hypothetical protein